MHDSSTPARAAQKGALRKAIFVVCILPSLEKFAREKASSLLVRLWRACGFSYFDKST